MKQRLNKAKKYKEQERLANLAIARAWAYGCTLRQPQTKKPVLAGFTVQHFVNYHKDKVLKLPTKTSTLIITQYIRHFMNLSEKLNKVKAKARAVQRTRTLCYSSNSKGLV
jgi:hypothetical protein